jgi:hypothetical protein
VFRLEDFSGIQLLKIPLLLRATDIKKKLKNNPLLSNSQWIYFIDELLENEFCLPPWR